MRSVGIYGGSAPGSVDTAALAELLRQKSAERADAAAVVEREVSAVMAAWRRAHIVRPVPPAAELPRWNEPHDCGAYAEHVHTRTERIRFGVAVWLVQECEVCGRLWDVLSDESSEGVIVASVFPVWAVTSCVLCCAGRCTGAQHPCPCHTVPEEA